MRDILFLYIELLSSNSERFLWINRLVEPYLYNLSIDKVLLL
jgi:hypothetical protein